MKLLRGVVHDPTARRMGGVAGHAGLFSTAADLATFCRMLLGGGAYRGVRILSPLAVARMTSRATPADERNVRGLGWDIDSSFSSNRGELLPIGSFGHTGFTGTSLWLDPASGMFVIFLSNRVHPDGKGDVTSLRARVATVAASALPGLRLCGNRFTGTDFGPPGSPPAAAPAHNRPCRYRRASRRRLCAAQGQTRRSGDEPHGTRPRRLDDHRPSARFIDSEGTHACGTVQPRAWHPRRARGERAVDEGREDRTAYPFALRRHTPADRRDAERHRHAGRSTCRTSARVSTHT